MKELKNTMVLKITILIAALVIFNFILLIFSCNKTLKKAKIKNIPLERERDITIVQAPEVLAPTGS